MSDFDDKLDVPRDWAEDLLEELADSHHMAFTCDRRGGFRSHVNSKRREFLQGVLGLSNVDYRLCMYCQQFALADEAREWPYPGVCPNCTDKLPDVMKDD